MAANRKEGMMSVKKAWTKPVLILVGKGTPEENAILACSRTARACMTANS
jgi:hypothetical protein